MALQRNRARTEASLQLLCHASHATHLCHRLWQRSGVHGCVEGKGSADHYQLPDCQPGCCWSSGGHIGYALGCLPGGRMIEMHKHKHTHSHKKTQTHFTHISLEWDIKRDISYPRDILSLFSVHFILFLSVYYICKKNNNKRIKRVMVRKLRNLQQSNTPATTVYFQCYKWLKHLDSSEMMKIQTQHII